MKKYILVFVALLAVTSHLQAQKYLDIYRNGKIVSSIKAADVDSMVVGMNHGYRTLYLYKEGETFYSTMATKVDSVKVYNSEEVENEPLVYLGIIGFNQELYEKNFGILCKYSDFEFKSFVSSLTCKDGTLLYYGVDKAIDMLNDYSFPTSISSINLVTFTDGLDQGSLMMSSDYMTDEEYLNAVSNRIKSTKIKGLPLTAYSLGLRGNDVTNNTLFQNNLNKLASSSDKAFEMSSMDGVRNCLQDISDQIISISNKQTISMKIPGQSNGTIVRFTFDNSSALYSSLYIEGTFNLADRSLHNVTYHGLKSESGSIVQGQQNGIFVTYTFNGLQREDGCGLVPTNNICLYCKSENTITWQANSEFSTANNTQTSVSHSGAIIMLVLDCSSSLGSQFSNMQSYAKDFIDRIADNAVEHVERPYQNGAGEYVDLALPSGTLWATCNIGASSPEDYGDRFAWGDIEVYDSKKTYDYNNTYRWYDKATREYTKYNIVDNKTKLDLEDDAAYVSWGPDWCMPTANQFRELVSKSYTTTIWTTQNGVDGLKITSKNNGNSLFLPGEAYWSCTLTYGYGSPGIPIMLQFSSSYIYVDANFGRFAHNMVRPVRLLE